MTDVRCFERRLREFAGDGALELELRWAAIDLAVVANVIELSPTHRIDAGSLAHERILVRLERLERLIAEAPDRQLAERVRAA